ncbi:hypothetical protein yc1106_04759 [Curvularia clavata]|uniref:NACHT domain-containing protein n=1 Tax=Curvularia clavata TaxID=95742 RepID=A0A9Q9DSZ6_CURCL|nr:hypothetical protein yc1106_04759 [Curvularia clavata]
MRLLQYSGSGELSVHSFGDGDVPPYAILSHTWGADGEEVTFADLQTGHGRTKPGYEKIIFCARQAGNAGLQYFWIDTCCIDTSDKAEHSWSIRSMFRWYRFAAQCYVYLPDVSTDDISVQSSWELAFRSSRWFTRGWTLQELLAPSSVEFFSREGEKLGDRVSLAPLINKITGIPPLVLNGTPIFQFSIDDRWRWAEGRITRRSEDRAYSLQGIFGVEIAPVYGEGESGAFDRLKREIYKLERCLEDMRSTDPRDDKRRIEDTKGGLVTDSYRWVLGNTEFRQWHEDQHSRLLWVKGDPGKGKTMLLCGIIDELQNLPRCTLVSYFFCQATDSRINSATAILRGLLYMLIVQEPSLVAHVREKHAHAGGSLFNDANAWIALTEIFFHIVQNASVSPIYLIIDALDECISDQPKLLKFIADQSSVSSRVKWILSSRNWPTIEEQLERAEYKTRLSLELNAESVATAVRIFIQQKVGQLAQEKRYTPEIQDSVLQHLTLNSNDTFLWVALVCQDLKATPKWNVLKKLAHFPPGLDSLYRRMLLQIRQSESAEICLGVLAVTCILYRPVTVTELVALAEQIAGFDEDLESVREIIGLCGSFLTLRGDTVYFVHQSAKDFLFEKSLNEVFPQGLRSLHRDIFMKSLTLLHKVLCRDMYSLEKPGYRVEDVIPPSPDPLALSRYPCVYWIDHLCDSRLETSDHNGNNVEDAHLVDSFMRRKYLYWLEALSLCRSMENGVVSMIKLSHLVQKMAEKDAVTTSVTDAQRFIMYHKNAIENYPLQAYASALLFSPTDSLIRMLFQHEALEKMTIKPATNHSWGACLQTLNGSSLWAYSVAFSRDSTRIAAGYGDSTVKIWDASSGICMHTLEGHNRAVQSVAFSHDSRLASGSDDGTIKVWNASSGTCLQTLESHRSVASVVFSHDSARIASSGLDNTVKVWDTTSWTCLLMLEGQSGMIMSVAFSHDSSRIASGARDGTVKIWDTNSGVCLQTLEDHGNEITSVVFSHDSTQIASATYNSPLKIWDVRTGICSQMIGDTRVAVKTVIFSHDSAWLASGTTDSTINIWDARSGACLHTFEGHTGDVTSLALSHDSKWLVSGSEEGAVKLWDASSRDLRQAPGSHRGYVASVTFSSDLAWLISRGTDQSIRIWDVSTGICLHIFEREDLHMPGSEDDDIESVTISPNSAWLVSASRCGHITLWDLSTKTCSQVLEGLQNGTWQPVTISSNSAYLAFASSAASLFDDDLIKIWDISNGMCLQSITAQDRAICLLALSHDSAWLVSTSFQATRIWDVSSGVCLRMIKRDYSKYIYSIALSPDSAWLAESTFENTIRIWNTSSWECQHVLDVDTWSSTLSFDPTGTLLHTDMGAITIPNLEVPSSTGTAKSEAYYKGINVTKDGTWIFRDGNNIVWIPYEYWSRHVFVSGAHIGMGLPSGRVWIFHIDE